VSAPAPCSVCELVVELVRCPAWALTICAKCHVYRRIVWECPCMKLAEALDRAEGFESSPEECQAALAKIARILRPDLPPGRKART